MTKCQFGLSLLHRKGRLACIVILIALHTFCLTAQPNVTSDSVYLIKEYPSTTTDLTSTASIFEDQSGDLTIDDVQNQLYEPLSDFSTQQLDNNIYWVRLAIKSDLQSSSEWRLQLFDDWCEEVEVYSKVVEEGTDWHLQRAGYLTKLEDLDQSEAFTTPLRKVPNGVSLILEPQEQMHIYVRYKRVMRHYIYIHPQLTPIVTAANDIIDYDRKSFYTLAIMGMLIILAFYHLLVYIMIGDRAYLFYALYTGTAAFAGTVMDQFGFMNYHLFYSDHPYIQPWVFNWVGTTAVAFYILFTRSFLNTRERFPRLDIALLVLLGIGLLSAIIGSVNFILTGRQYLPGMPFPAYMVLIAFVFGLLLIYILRERRPTDIFYLVGLGLMLAVLTPGYLFDLLGMQNLKAAVTSITVVSTIQIGLLIELLIFALGLGYRTRQLQIQKQHFEELDRLKSRFFANISHEFRTPLTLILGPLETIKSKLSRPEDLKLVRLIRDNAQTLLHLVNQVLDLSKLENKRIKLAASPANIIPYLKGIFFSFESLADQKNITQTFLSEYEDIELYFDPLKMETIITNLLSNAFKFSKDGGTIQLEVKKWKNDLVIKLSDSGAGIEEEKLPYIFDRYYQANNEGHAESHGSGIGLAIVKELVQLHHGDISATSQLGQGTSFEVTIPLGKVHLAKDEIIPTEHIQIIPEDIQDNGLEKAHIEVIPAEKTGTSKALPTILLIEDHKDVRAFIQSQLFWSFHIVEAENGAVGITKAKELVPDLIICDVMMPEKDGYEVCALLKSDIRTSHIPIILLTAKAAREEKLEGLQSGADDYLVKPFDTQELLIRVTNLIALRKQLRARFSTAVQIKPSEVSINSVDQKFMNKALQIVEQNMENENFNIEMMTKEVGMSATQLNRKLRALIDQSTNQFIKSVRLQRAADLLKQNAGTVSEVAFKTGFNSAAYFVSTFKGHFGMTPGVYRNNYLTKEL